MQCINRFAPLAFCMLSAAATTHSSFANEPVSLMGTIVKWRYSDAEIGKSEMSDAATIAANGQRTVPSVILNTTMTTPDSVSKVLAFYQKLLKRNQTNDRFETSSTTPSFSFCLDTMRLSDVLSGLYCQLRTALMT